MPEQSPQQTEELAREGVAAPAEVPSATMPWGEWVRRRAALFGITSARQLMKRAGISLSPADRIMAGLPVIARHVQSRTREGLCRALAIDEETLMERWAAVSPGSGIPVVTERPDPMRRAVMDAAGELDGDGLRLLYVAATALLERQRSGCVVAMAAGAA